MNDTALSCSVQMMYTTADIKFVVGLRERTANALGFWHTFKMAHYIVFRQFSMLFFAPLFHYIIPGHPFFVHPSRLINMQEWFTLLRLSFDDEVKAAIRTAFADNRINEFSKSILQAFKDLCNFFIPVVCTPL
jgi:hypothetical protein